MAPVQVTVNTAVKVVKVIKKSSKRFSPKMLGNISHSSIQYCNVVAAGNPVCMF